MGNELTVKAVERALELLKQFSFERPVLGVSELARLTSMHKGTVYRFLLTLEQHNFVEKDPDTQRYRLGLALFQLGSIVQANMDVRRVALPVMRALAQESKETVNLNIVWGRNRVCIECIETARSVRTFVQVGLVGPLTRGASGKVLLAHMDPFEVRVILDGMEYDDQIRIQEELAKIRKQGFAVTRGDRLAEAASVSAPIFDYAGRLAAGLTISGPRVRFTPEVVERFIKLVTDAADQISMQLGWRIRREGQGEAF